MASEQLIVGRVTSGKHAVIPLTLYDSGDKPYTLDAMVDTGFNGDLSLPRSLVRRLNLARTDYGQAVLADGRVCKFDVHCGTILWFGRRRPIVVAAMDSPPTIGMELLTNHLLTIMVAEGGEVTVKRF